MRPPQGLSQEQIDAAEQFAARTGIGPLFDLRPLHHGQHPVTCEPCRAFRKNKAKRARARRAAATLKQPWETKR